MSHRSLLFLACLCALSAGTTGCGGSSGGAEDAGSNADASSAIDASTAIDASSAVDASSDAGPNADAGPTPDAPVLTTCTPATGTNLRLERVANGLSRPVFVTSPPGDPRLFIVQQRGRIRILDDGQVRGTDFLDLSSSGLDLVSSSGNERGLLGLAFHPDYATNGRFFVNYTKRSGGATVIAEYKVSGDANVASTTGATVLEIPQFAGNHNGGMITFGPDGYLYIGMGDGGGSGDPNENGEDNTTLLGAMLRIDVDSGSPYGIPGTNPFSSGAGGAKPEIWATGLRNPWRFSFDRTTGDLYIADVGQGKWEEIDVQPASSTGGEDYGWDLMEGNECFEPSTGCDMTGLTPPVHVYDHNSGECSVTGGYVYRGDCMPDVKGWYFYADFCTNQVFKFEYSGGVATAKVELTSDLASTGLSGISSFGQDAAGELYVVDLGAGEVFRIVLQ